MGVVIRCCTFVFTFYVGEKKKLMFEGITQFYCSLDEESWKFELLCDLYEEVNIHQSVIYCNTKRKMEWLTDQMRQRDHIVAVIHGEMDPKVFILSYFFIYNKSYLTKEKKKKKIKFLFFFCVNRYWPPFFF